jgi:iron-sulfur cluster repair protein YtfE (RIC family)
MDTITDTLTRIHHLCDDHFVNAENAVAQRRWDDASRLFHELRTTTERHLQTEEEVLFPAFERGTGSAQGPTAMMRMEHTQMRELLQAMADSLGARDAARYLGLSETLLTLMQQHNVKEENVLYPMSDRLLAAQRAEILARMDVQAPHAAVP